MGGGISTQDIRDKMALGLLDAESLMFNKDEMFRDDEFSPTCKSITGTENVAKASGDDEIDDDDEAEVRAWVRAQHLGGEDSAAALAIFGGRELAPFDVVSPPSSDPYRPETNAFAVSVAALCLRQDYIRTLFVFYSWRVGMAVLRLYIDGKWELVIIDDFVPVQSASHVPLFTHIRDGSVWVLLLEKALAKRYGSYAALHARTPSDITMDLTGECIIDYSFPLGKRALDFLHDPSVGYLSEVLADSGCTAMDKSGLTDAQYIKSSFLDSSNARSMSAKHRNMQALGRAGGKDVLPPEYQLAPPQPLSKKVVHRFKHLREPNGLYAGARVDDSRRPDTSLRAWLQVHAERVNNREFICLLTCHHEREGSNGNGSGASPQAPPQVYIISNVKIGIPGDTTEMMDGGIDPTATMGGKRAVWVQLLSTTPTPPPKAITGPVGNLRRSSVVHTAPSNIPDLTAPTDPRTQSIYGDGRIGIDVYKAKRRASQAQMFGIDIRSKAIANGAQKDVFKEERAIFDGTKPRFDPFDTDDLVAINDDDISIGSEYSAEDEVISHRHHSTFDRSQVARGRVAAPRRLQGKTGRATRASDSLVAGTEVKWTDVQRLQKRFRTLHLSVLVGKDLHNGILEQMGAGDPADTGISNGIYVSPKFGAMGANDGQGRVSTTISKTVLGCWKGADGSAGGSVLHGSWGHNPIYRVTLDRPTSHVWTVRITLSQLGGEGSSGTFDPIAVTVLKDRPELLARHRLAQTAYWAKRDVGCAFSAHDSFDTDSGTADASQQFLVVPSTFEPFCNGSFLLTVACTDTNAGSMANGETAHGCVFHVTPLLRSDDVHSQWVETGLVHRTETTGSWKPVQDEVHARRLVKGDDSTLDNTFSVRVANPGASGRTRSRSRCESDNCVDGSNGGDLDGDGDLAPVLDMSVASSICPSVSGGGSGTHELSLDQGLDVSQQVFRGEEGNMVFEHVGDDASEEESLLLAPEIPDAPLVRQVEDEEGKSVFTGSSLAISVNDAPRVGGSAEAHAAALAFAARAGVTAGPGGVSHRPAVAQRLSTPPQVARPTCELISCPVRMMVILTYTSRRHLTPVLSSSKPPFVAFDAHGGPIALTHPSSRASCTYILPPSAMGHLLRQSQVGVTSNTTEREAGFQLGKGLLGDCAMEKGCRSVRELTVPMLSSDDPTSLPLQRGEWCYGQEYGEVLLCPMPWAPTEKAAYRLTVLSDVPLVVKRVNKKDLRKRYATVQ